MRAKFINEFERGIDPKTSLGIGWKGKIHKCFKDLNIPDHDYEITLDSVIFKKALRLEGKNITWLPDNLIAKKSLYLNNAQITKLPNNLTVGWDLYLSYTNITKLPFGLKVGWACIMDNTRITELSDDLNAKSVFLNNTPIKKWPNNLKYIDEDLILFNTLITELPNNFKVGNDLNLGYTKITKLPNGLKVGRNISLHNTLIEELPDDIQIGGMIVVDKKQKKLINFIKNNTNLGDRLNFNYNFF